MLSSEDQEVFHSIVTTYLYNSNRSRPYIYPTISILCGRVRDANKNDWEKLRRLVKYLAFTKDLHLILHYDGISLARWHINTSIAVHGNFKSHSRGLLMLSEKAELWPPAVQSRG